MDDASTLPHLKEQLALVVEKTPGVVADVVKVFVVAY